MIVKIHFYFLFLPLMLSANFANSQIINIERQRIITDTVGWSGDAVVAFNAVKFNKSHFSFDFNNHIQFKSNSNLFLLFNSFSLINAGGQKFDNSGFIHFRYNRSLIKLVKLEAFYQAQLNELLKINLRSIYGLGLRIKPFENNHLKIYLGTTYMYETEKSSSGIFTKVHRSSNYLSFSISFNQNFSLRNTIYYQPLFENWADHRFSNDTHLTLKITKHLNFAITYHFMYDTFPAENSISKANYSFMNGIQYHFGI